MTAPSSRELLGFAARAMVAQDARWIADAVLSSTQRDDLRGVVPLVLFGHSARITYEGSIALQSHNPHVGIPILAELLPDQQSPVIGRARHGAKLLDDSKKTFENLVQEMGQYYLRHHAEFTGNAVRFARWLESDLGLYTVKGGLLGGTIPLHFRFGAPPTITVSELSPLLYDVSFELGGALAVLGAAVGDGSSPSATTDYSPLGRISARDRRATRYLGSRYDPALPIEAKLLLLMVEGEANATRLFLPLAESGVHQEAIFRARVVSLFHVLSAVERILMRYPRAQAPRTRAVREFISDAAVQYFVHNKGMRTVRNRCMHYEIRNPTAVVNLSAPMFGLVESLCPGRTFEQVNTEASALAGRVADVLAAW